MPEFHKRGPLQGNAQVGNLFQHPADKRPTLCLVDPVDEGRNREEDAHPEGSKAIFGKAEVEEGGYGDGDGGSAELFLLLGEVGAADVVDSAFVAEAGEEEVHFWRSSLEVGLGTSWGGEGRGKSLRKLERSERVLSSARHDSERYIPVSLDPGWY